ncbi:MAG: hypothetical protein MJE68_23475, partial [Proteobacteria bacterium]|nr:hypothetical protein [Pseudomonadota bacterium]
MLKDAKQMFYHSMIEHLGVLCWGCPFCKRCFQNRNSYLRHIQWGHKGIPKFKKRIIDEFGAVMPCPVVEADSHFSFKYIKQHYLVILDL